MAHCVRDIARILLILASVVTINAHADLRLDKNYFVVHYDPDTRLAEYVEYTLTAAHLRASFVKRKNHFHADEELIKKELSAVGPTDYAHSGYDRGHLAPSGDFEWSEDANEATFVMTNIAPQAPRLNRIAWARLEDTVRTWACADGQLRIVTGPVIESNLPTTDKNLRVPRYFFKVILDEKAPRKAIGFLMTQDETSADSYKSDHKTLKEIEKITGLQFFTDLPKAERARIEDEDNLSAWHGSQCKGSDSKTTH